jgi:uncharacterized protein (TIRG00374 family)
MKGGRWLIGLAGLSLSAGLIAVALAYADLGEVADRFTAADRSLLGLIAALAVFDHAVRFLRWHLLVRQVAGGRKNVPRSLVAYLAGGPMIFTPARAGEVLRSAFTRQLIQAPVARTVPVLVAERIADVAVMALLASAGLVAIGRLTDNWVPLAVATGLVLAMLTGAGIVVGGGLGGRIPYRWRYASERLAAFASAARESGRILLSQRSLATAGSLGLIAWGVEVAIYALAIQVVGGVPASPVVLAALAVFPLASLIGALSLAPGGVGATEGSLAGLGVALAGLVLEASLAAGLLARAAILLVVILAGIPAILMVLVISRRAELPVQATAPQ